MVFFLIVASFILLILFRLRLITLKWGDIIKQELIKNFDFDFEKFKELRYLTDRQIERLVDEFYRLSVFQLGYPDRRYIRIHAYNYCVAPWCGNLPETLDDPARKYWVYYYHRALKMFFYIIESRFNFNDGGF